MRRGGPIARPPEGALRPSTRLSIPKAVESLTANWERVVGFFDFPAEHSKHLSTIDAIDLPSQLWDCASA